MLTTAGMTRSATDANASSIERSTPAGSWGWARAVTGISSNSTTSSSGIMDPPGAMLLGAGRLRQRHPRKLEHTARRARDRRERGPAQPGDPDDLGARNDQWQAVTLPARNARVDQERLQASLTRAAEGNERVSSASGADAERTGQRVRIERDTIDAVRRRVLARPRKAAHLDRSADFGHRRGALQDERSRAEPAARAAREANAIATHLDRDGADGERAAGRGIPQDTTESAVRPCAEPRHAAQSLRRQAQDLGCKLLRQRAEPRPRQGDLGSGDGRS